MANARTYHEPEAAIRRPPSYPEYGSDLLSLERVKLMSLAERGLLATLRWHLWANDTVPADPKAMARLLGLEAAEVQAALTDRVLSFLAPAPGAPDRLYSPELHAQMTRLLERREKMVRGAKHSHIARKVNAKESIGTHAGTHVGEHMPSELHCTAQNRTALGKATDQRTPSKSNGSDHDPFVAELEAAEARERAGGSGTESAWHR